MKRTLLATAILLFMFYSGCHSSENLERQVMVLQQELEAAKKENRELRSRLDSEEMKSLRDLQHQVESYSKRLEECRIN
jgi:thioredoxin-related protein